MIKDIEFFIKNIIFSEKFLLEKRLKRGLRKNYEKELSVIDKFKDRGMKCLDLSDDELAKMHLRHMVGGRLPDSTNILKNNIINCSLN